jgi:hypothetical protein
VSCCIIVLYIYTTYYIYIIYIYIYIYISHVRVVYVEDQVLEQPADGGVAGGHPDHLLRFIIIIIITIIIIIILYYGIIIVIIYLYCVMIVPVIRAYPGVTRTTSCGLLSYHYYL